MAYYVLDRPEGTYPYKQGLFEQGGKALKAGADIAQDYAVRKAIGKEKLTPEFTKDPATGQWKITYKKPTGEKDTKFKLQMWLAGLSKEPPEGMKAGIEEASPFKMGEAGGGTVTTPFGATKKEGEIFGPAGKRIGEYAPGFEPKKTTEPTRTTLREGIVEDPFARAAMGLGKKKVEKVKEPTTKDRYIIWSIKKMKEQNAPLEDIMAKIIGEKRAPEDFEEYWRDYVPQKKAGRKWPWGG